MATSDIIQSIEQNLSNAYTTAENKGATIPTNKNLENLQNTINSIPSGGDTHDATATVNDILYDKTAYIATGKVTGTMPNNGELNYTPTTSTQIIPTGYTSGGIINPAIMGEEDYDTCIDLADYIMYGGEPPAPYIELEYIQSTGTQYIDTELTVSEDYGLDLDANITFSTDSSYIGATNSSRQTGPSLCIVSFEYRFTQYLTQDFQRKTWDNEWGNCFGSRHVLGIREGHKILLDGVQVETKPFSYSSEITNSLCIFGVPSSRYGNGKMKLYGAKVYDNDNNVIGNFIPVKRTKDDEICLYDKVSKTFFENAGTGVFIAGPEKEAV